MYVHTSGTTYLSRSQVFSLSLAASLLRTSITPSLVLVLLVLLILLVLLFLFIQHFKRNAHSNQHNWFLPTQGARWLVKKSQLENSTCSNNVMLVLLHTIPKRRVQGLIQDKLSSCFDRTFFREFIFFSGRFVKGGQCFAEILIWHELICCNPCNLTSREFTKPSLNSRTRRNHDVELCRERNCS